MELLQVPLQYSIIPRNITKSCNAHSIPTSIVRVSGRTLSYLIIRERKNQLFHFTGHSHYWLQVQVSLFQFGWGIDT